MDWLSLFFVFGLAVASFVAGAYYSGSRWEARYIPAMIVVNAAFHVVMLLRKHDRNSIVDPPTVLDLEQAMDGLEKAVDHYAEARYHVVTDA